MTGVGADVGHGACGPLALHARVTLDDQVRMNEWLLDLPGLRRRRLVVRALTLLVMPVLGVVLGASVASVQNGEPFWSGLGWAAGDRGSQAIVVVVDGLMLALWTVLRLLRRPLLRRRLRRTLLERPGIDPADRTLAEPVRLLLDDEGFVSETVASTTRVPWITVKGLADAGTLLVLRTGRFSGYIVPKRDLSTADEAALRAAVARAGR